MERRHHLFNIQHLCYDAVGCYLKQQTQFYGGKQSKAEVCRLEPTNNFRLGKHHHQTHAKQNGWMPDVKVETRAK